MSLFTKQKYPCHDIANDIHVYRVTVYLHNNLDFTKDIDFNICMYLNLSTFIEKAIEDGNFRCQIKSDIYDRKSISLVYV